ncbi:PsiF family protein [Methylocystis sp.]|uniref:PsiF family protein n=1 Tax=Methylocystis sp. TaxID=1911079 RepID=UPI003D11E5C8
MFTSVKCIAAGVVCASLSFGAALAEPKTSTPAGNAATTWAPPAEIAPKAAPAEAAAPNVEAPAATAQPAPAAPAAKTHAQREKDCRAQADAKGLHGKERKQFKAGCLKG